MGANDKVEATYHGHTPTTNEVRHAYLDYVDYANQVRGLASDDNEPRDGFNNWLDRVRAEAKAEAFEEAANVVGAWGTDYVPVARELSARANQYSVRSE